MPKRGLIGCHNRYAEVFFESTDHAHRTQSRAADKEYFRFVRNRLASKIVNCLCGNCGYFLIIHNPEAGRIDYVKAMLAEESTSALIHFIGISRYEGNAWAVEGNQRFRNCGRCRCRRNAAAHGLHA